VAPECRSLLRPDDEDRDASPTTARRGGGPRSSRAARSALAHASVRGVTEPKVRETPEPTQAHDALFKKTFSQVAHAAGELRAVLPAALVERIDFSSLTLCSGSYLDEALRGSESDLLFSAKVSGKSAFLYLLFEHQSRPDPLMPLRILGYMLRILDVHVTSAESPSRALPLPLVVPVVLHHGEGGWSAARRLEDLFDGELVAEAGLHDFIPRLSFVLDDLSGQSDEALEARQLALEPLLACGRCETLAAAAGWRAASSTGCHCLPSYWTCPRDDRHCGPFFAIFWRSPTRQRPSRSAKPCKPESPKPRKPS
jgi:Putative transposase, YhgA-like